jgi:sterol desaturase/sphingolipid hydroxylase (fatty acid hydroxylase superfamily)
MNKIFEIILNLSVFVVAYVIYLFFNKTKISLPSFLVVNTVVSFLVVLFYYIVDVYKIPKCISDKKIQKDACVDLEEYHHIIHKAIWKYFFIYIPIFFFYFYLLDYRNKHFPGFSKVKITFVTFFILYFCSSFFSGFVTYFIHKGFHTEYLYPLHKGHHTYIAPVAVSAFDGNPIEILIWNILPVFSFSLFFGVHKYVMYVFGLIGSVVAILSHSGYRFTDYEHMDIGHHDLHHERMKCNYSTPFVDKVMGTYMYRETEKIYPRFDKTEKDISESVNTTCK